jgi:hypothetical protein
VEVQAAELIGARTCRTAEPSNGGAIMGSKIAWRPKVPLWSDGVITQRHRPGARLGIAALLCGLAAVSAHSMYLQFAGEQERASTAAQTSTSLRPILVAGSEPSRQGRSTWHPNMAPGAVEMAPTVAETTGTAGPLFPLPSAVDSNAKIGTADVAPVKTEQPDASKPARKSRTAKKKPTRAINTAQVYTLPDGRQVIVHRPGRNVFASFGGPDGFWGGNDFGTKPGQPIRVARPRAFDWPF